MQQVCHLLDIKQSLTPLYHPEANTVERKNRDVKPRLAILVKNKHISWPEHPPTIKVEMNTVKSEHTGYFLEYLNFCREL